MRFIRKTRYTQDINLVAHRGQVLWYGLLLLAVFSGPLWLDRFLLGEFAFVFIYAIAGLGLMILVGYTGLVSLGHWRLCTRLLFKSGVTFSGHYVGSHTVLCRCGWADCYPGAQDDGYLFGRGDPCICRYR